MTVRNSPRKIIKDYAVPIIATVLFIVTFLSLWVVHQYALASVKNLADTNPLITTDETKLVSNDQSTEPVIEQFSDEQVTTPPASSTPSASTSGSPSGQTAQSGSSGTQQSRPSSGSTSTSGGSSKPSSPQAPFATSLGSITDNSRRTSVMVTLLGIVLGCTVDHEFKIAVSGQNGPGQLKYRWTKSTGGEAVVEQKDFSAGSSSVELTHTMTTSSWGEYWVNLEVLSPTPAEKKYTFNHQC